MQTQNENQTAQPTVHVSLTASVRSSVHSPPGIPLTAENRHTSNAQPRAKNPRETFSTCRRHDVTHCGAAVCTVHAINVKRGVALS